MERIKEELVIILAISLWIALHWVSTRKDDGEENSYYIVENFSNAPSSPPSVKYRTCSRWEMPRVEQEVLNKTGTFSKVDSADWDVWYPCGFTGAQAELEGKKEEFASRKSGWVMAVPGLDKLAAKDQIWNIIEKRYGRERASVLMPETFVTYDAKAMERFAEYRKQHPEAMFILKKNIQRQEGLRLLKKGEGVSTAFNEGYVVVQRILENPYILNGRKINIRVYCLFVCHNGIQQLYVHDDGFIYYSKVLYEKGTTMDEIVTTGYIDRKVYNDSPLTFSDLRGIFDRKHGLGTSNAFVVRRNKTLRLVFDAVSDVLCLETNADLKFSQLYGVDIQPNNDLQDIKVIEMNKGPSMAVMDEKDGKVKRNIMLDMYTTLGMVSTRSPGGSGSSGFKLIR